MPPEDARAAFLWACALDVHVRKPGNVSVSSPGHGMAAEVFLASANAAIGPLFEKGTRVGRRIESAIERTRAVAGCNTNLGIVLLCAPLAAAVERLTPDRSPGQGPSISLQHALQNVLATLDVEDARAAYRAIALANPGGLGRAQLQDVAQTPTVDLVAAMKLAAERDRIALQYATGFDDVFGFGLRWFKSRATPADAVLLTYLAFLANFPDSHIVRKFGPELAQTVMGEARVRLDACWEPSCAGDPLALATWDDDLKARCINPGTSADLTVATAFVAAVLDPALLARVPLAQIV